MSGTVWSTVRGRVRTTVQIIPSTDIFSDDVARDGNEAERRQVEFCRELVHLALPAEHCARVADDCAIDEAKVAL